ncbi:MAG: hypothetical protein M3M99_02095 [Actinomycetota bacterium]|nr:hypothetical protein [Actinomycetota bacterium]
MKPGPPGKGIRTIPAGMVAIAVVALALALADASAGLSKKAAKQPRGPYPSLGKCPLFPQPSVAANAPSVADLSAWNQDISQAPLDPNSANYIAYINAHGATTLHPDFGSPRPYGFPYSVVGRKQKRLRVEFTAYGDESTQGKYRVPAKALIEGGQGSDGDRHVISVDRRRCRLFELYRAFFEKSKKGGHWNADAGVIWDLGSAALRAPGHTSADAAGLPIFPGLIRYDEAAAGQINHAIRVTFQQTQRAWLNPASHCASNVSDPNAPPMGMRLRLNGAYDISGLSGHARVIAAALKRYGFLVADNGSNWFFSGSSDKRWDDDNLNQLKAIPGSAFEVVQSAAAIHRC